MSKKSKPKFYVVWRGRTPGIYTNWTEASEQVTAYAGAEFKSFESRAEAEAAFRGRYGDYAGKQTRNVPKKRGQLTDLGVLVDSWAVDAACSGVPGPMEYRGVHIATGEETFRCGPFPDGTNNIGEFLAIVHAAALLQKRNLPNMPIYSDSRNARNWVRDKACRTKLERTGRNDEIFDLIERAVRWLKANPIPNPILTWETENWGENPADFGRK